VPGADPALGVVLAPTLRQTREPEPPKRRPLREQNLSLSGPLPFGVQDLVISRHRFVSYALEVSNVKIPCPASACRAENDMSNTHCIECGIALREYVRLYLYGAHLFNAGLRNAQSGQFHQARDLFAAVVHWCPTDREARNALAAACFSLGDKTGARDHWQEVLRRFPADPFATQGLEHLARTERHSAKMKRHRPTLLTRSRQPGKRKP
jgi:hypothetical protein